METKDYKLIYDKPPPRPCANCHSLTAALDACVEALTSIGSWRLRSEMSGMGPDYTNKDELLDLAITLARAARDAVKKVRGT